MRCTDAEYISIFKALSDETRLRTVQLLASGELCACKILEEFNVTQPTLSYHMNILCQSGLVESYREGSWTKYSLNKERLIAMRELCDGITRQLDNE